jgi:hypothetical protein
MIHFNFIDLLRKAPDFAINCCSKDRGNTLESEPGRIVEKIGCLEKQVSLNPGVLKVKNSILKTVTAYQMGVLRLTKFYEKSLITTISRAS